MAIDLFSIGPFTVHGYGLMIGIGFALAVFAGCFLAKKKGLSDNDFINMAMWVLVIGFAGGKLLHILVEFKLFLTDPMAVIGSSGFVVYGGIITGVLSVVVYCKVKKLNVLDYLDIFGAAVPLNQSLGRVGCFLAGCCYGRETDSPIGVVFPEGCCAPAGVRVLPTQVFMAIGDMVMFIALSAFFLKTKQIITEDGQKEANGFHKYSAPGCTASLYLILYSVGRFVIEFFRNDERGAVGALSTSQFIAIFTFAAGVILFFLISGKGKSQKEG